MSKYDSQGREIIAAPWSAIDGVPTMVSQLGGLVDPGADSYVKWNDSLNSLEFTPIPSTTNITVNGGGVNLVLFDLAGRPAGAVTVTLTIPYGAVITSLSPTSPALDLRGFTSGSTLAITNLGHVLGRGGRAGNGTMLMRSGGEEDFAVYPQAGEAGGTAIYGPGTGITCTIDNANGYIWGGGGGGGGGGASCSNSEAAVGGGGGGGAGFGTAGFGMGNADCDAGTPASVCIGSPGTSGSRATTTANGTGGAGAGAGSGAGGTGGDGGDWGTAGSAGASPTSGASDIAGGAGGAAGKAVDLNGGSVSITAGSSTPHVKGAVS